MYVKPGDKVMFSTHGHQVTKLNGEELIVLRQNSIIGILYEDKPYTATDVDESIEAWRKRVAND
jgi:hypothetical protein